ncbi:MAG: PHP domain-containing protein [Bacteroidia bacterium]|nr:PHP domain-containing protein [Bacteroidia bacterium]
MLDNHDIANILTQYAKLYELHDGNPFKVKSLASAAFNIKKIGQTLAELNEEELIKIPQIGKSLAPKVYEIIQTGTFQDLENLLKDTPDGIIDILKVKGLGPKKVEILWKQVGITSIPELLDACRENRLVEIKGFGYKTQSQIISDIEFKFSNEGKFHWAKMENIVNYINDLFKDLPEVLQFEVCGDFRRLNDIVNSIDYLIVCSDLQAISEHLCNGNFQLVDCYDNHYILTYLEYVNINLYKCDYDNWGNKLIELSSTPEHLELIGFKTINANYESEEEVYNNLKLPYIIPELREGLKEIEKLSLQSDLITFSELKGVLHNHTNYSDGLNTVEEMALFARGLGLQYIGICDHSQTAAYANGLKPERVIEQMKLIDRLNEVYAKEDKPIKIFKGIESDILNDGSLDYSDDILQLFDIVVASIHSNLKMDKEKAHLRLIKAIENPYTTILGHLTGRLLLMRPGYPIDHKYIIDACVQNNVVIELNAHPYRLDMDWRWIDYAVNKGGMISINPDAHQKEGLDDMRYGVNVARKGYLTAQNCLNALSVNEFEVWLEKNKRKKIK